MTQSITLLSRNASHDDLGDADYADIFAELRESLSLDKLCALLNSAYSKATWNKYERGETPLTRTMRNELRMAVGLSPLPPTVADATAQASPDAAVWRIGGGVPEHVILVASSPVTVHVNGGVQVIDSVSRVTEVTRALRARKRYVRPCIPETLLQRYSALQGVSWQDVIDAGLRSYEEKAQPEREQTVCSLSGVTEPCG